MHFSQMSSWLNKHDQSDLSLVRSVITPASGRRLPWFDLLSHSVVYNFFSFFLNCFFYLMRVTCLLYTTLIILHTAEDSFLTKKAHLLSSFSCWAVDFHISWIFQHKLLKIQAISYWNFFNVPPPFTQLKMFYIDNCLYIAVEIFSINNFVVFQRNFHHCFDVNFENKQCYAFSLLFFLRGWQPWLSTSCQ